MYKDSSPLLFEQRHGLLMCACEVCHLMAQKNEEKERINKGKKRDITKNSEKFLDL